MASTGNVLCVANFPTSAGYAWQYIESLYAAVADDLARYGVRTWVAYPRVDAAPDTLTVSAAEAIELPVRLNSPAGVLAVVRTVRRREIRTLYLTDRASWHPMYAVLRLAGVRRIVVHDHTSGARTPPRGLKSLLKRASRAFRPGLADVVLAVSDYVGRRAVEVALVPPARVRVTKNSVIVPPAPDREWLRREYGVAVERPVVACACRAAEYKGVQHLLEAFDRIHGRAEPRPVLIYFGDGPYMDALRSMRQRLDARDDIVLAGYRPDAADLLGGADVCVVPSIWAEAFGLAALEPAARGVPVVASRTGGIPEVVRDGETGVLVPPGDVEALAAAMATLLADPERRRSMGAAAREHAEAHFSRGAQLRELTHLFRSLAGVEE